LCGIDINSDGNIAPPGVPEAAYDPVDAAAEEHPAVTPAGRANAPQRQEGISRFVLERGTATIKEISDAFGVSVMTVHRDLAELSAQGVIRRFRGGASAQPSGVFESNVRYRMSTMLEAKAAIARDAAKLVESGMSVLLDDGTTTLALGKVLRDISPLTVITSHLETINVLAGSRDVRLISLGGEYRRNHDSFIGVQCIENLAALRADLAFLSSSAVAAGSAYHQEQEIVQVKRSMMACAGRSVLLVDHSKLGNVALHRFASLDEFDLVITDDEASAEQIEDLANHSVRFRLAAMDEPQKADPA
jgi:DeoR/GlpR family transcriptional regulator of sugar metabolism